MRINSIITTNICENKKLHIHNLNSETLKVPYQIYLESPCSNLSNFAIFVLQIKKATYDTLSTLQNTF